jgi:hypothetical protein
LIYFLFTLPPAKLAPRTKAFFKSRK